ncbi:plasmid mobilization protein [Moorena producens]|uniref:plasmid mobilization protein n=1 Tax=Moorena producens TaxID=1155739 RepID=UPI003C743A52
MKNKKLVVRVTDFEKQQLQQEADRRGMTCSELLRSFIARLPTPKGSVQNSSLETKP